MKGIVKKIAAISCAGLCLVGSFSLVGCCGPVQNKLNNVLVMKDSYIVYDGVLHIGDVDSIMYSKMHSLDFNCQDEFVTSKHFEGYANGEPSKDKYQSKCEVCFGKAE